MSIVQLASVRKSYGGFEILKGVDLSVARGSVVVVIGRSGSGKSTMLRCINGLEKIQGGEITVDGKPVLPDERALRELRRDVGFVFQSFNLFPHLTVERNITIGLTVVRGMALSDARAIAETVLKQVGLLEKRDVYPDNLSGGQQQRVAIARCLALSPKVMLFDEVTSSLDPELKGEVLKVIADLGQQGMTMILVTHEMQFARSVADHIAFMHEGRIWEEGPPDAFFGQPNTPELKQFIATSL